MSFRDCVIGKVREGKLSKDLAESLVEKYDNTLKKYMASGTPEGAATLAADDMLRVEVSRIEKKQANAVAHAIKMKEFNDKFKASSEPVSKIIGNEYDMAYVRVETVKHDMLHSLVKFADDLGVNAAGLGRNYEGVAKAVRYLLGEPTDDPNAKAFGDALKKMFDLGHERATNAGLVIGKIDNYFPRAHRKQAIQAQKATMEVWREDIKKHIDPATAIDRDTGRPMTPQRLDEALSNMYDSIMSDGRSKLKKLSDSGDKPSTGRGDIDTSWDDERFFEFKNADAFFEYNRKYGVGDEGLPALIIGHINTLSRDIAVAEKFGPKAYDMARFFDFKMVTENSKPFARRLQNAKFRVLAGLLEHGNVDHTIYKTFTGLQNINRASLLTGGVLNALPDSSVIAITSKFNGLEATKVLKRAVSAMAPGTSETKDVAKRLGYISYIVQGSAIGDTRFAGESFGGGMPRYLANLMNEINGTGRWTNAAQDGVTVEMLERVGHHISSNTSWDQLDAFMRSSLERADINAKDWADLKGAELMPHGEIKLLNTSDMRVDDALIAKLGKERVKDLADKVDDWTFAMRKTVTTEPTLGVKAIFSGAILGDSIDSRSGGLATPERYLMSTLGLFKSYPFSYVALHLMPAYQRWAAHKSIRNLDRLAMLAIGTSVMGGAVVQIQALANGVTPQSMDPTTAEGRQFWRKAFAKGGGLGPIGDFMFQDYSRYGKSLSSQLLGPTVGTVDDTFKAIHGNLDNTLSFGDDGTDQAERNRARDTFRLMKRNLPLVRVWYAKLLVDRLLLDNVERMLDPDFDRRIGKYERRMSKESGQEFWWMPGEKKPK